MAKTWIKGKIKAPRVTKAQRKLIEAGNVKQFASLLGLTLKGLCELYPKDLTRPGVVMAWLPGTIPDPAGKFYASMCRYEGSHENKVILAQAKGDTVEDTLRALVVNWHQGAKTGRELARVARRIMANPDDFDMEMGREG